MGKCRDAVHHMTTLITNRFETRVEGQPSKFLGIGIEIDSNVGEIRLHSTRMINHLLQTFGLSNARPASTPLPPGTVLYKGTKAQLEPDVDMSNIPYRQLVGSLLHIANTTRPDIMFATTILSRFLDSPGPPHWEAAKQVLRYLGTTRNLGIVFRRSGNPELLGYTDADFANDVSTRKSVSGFVFLLAGGPISWASKKQSIVAQSTLEAEYVAMSTTVREAVWLRRMYAEVFNTPRAAPTNIFGDNQGALLLAGKDVINAKTKQVEIRYHFTREKVQDGSVRFSYICSLNQIADIMTKSLGRGKHTDIVSMMGMEDRHMKSNANDAVVPSEGEC